MKKLLTVSAVVFLMIFTAGLATAKTPVSIFPFTGTGDLYSVTDVGVTATTTATITVHEASNGLFNGTIVYGTSPSQTTINFSAVLDSQGVYTFNGQTVVLVSPAPSVSVGIPGPVTVTGAFIITKEKEPGVKHKDLAAAIQFRTLGNGESFAGFLFK
jgi:hypothetical protein